jgi:pantoate--beta-alanine ligase
MQEYALKTRTAGTTIAFVPTMGFLHEGHASLLREGKKRGDILVLSIFVNPTPFGAGEDFEKYPRNMEQDGVIAEDAGVDIIFAPTASDMYPGGYQTYVNVEDLSLPLCGSGRPGHFRGVATVVSKLFNIVQPNVAFFGEKDYQQLAIIRRMTADLNMAVEIAGMPIVRESDGLAMSSRNSYLSGVERKSALCLSRALYLAVDCYRNGELSSQDLRCKVMEFFSNEPSVIVEYIELCHRDTLEAVDRVTDETLMALAVKIGKTRLIDNIILGRGFPCKERC